MSDVFEVQNYTGGIFLQAKEKQVLSFFNPATGKKVGNCPRSQKQDVLHALQSAETAFPLWSALPFQDRAHFLKKIADEIQKNQKEFAHAESLNTGKPLTLAQNVDIPRSIQNFLFFAAQVESLPEESVSDQNMIHKVVRHPLGVVVCISPWNLPLYLLTWKIAPALVYGNTVVAKPSEVTPLTAFLLSQVCEKVGLPPGVLNIIHGLGSECGEELCTNPKVKAVSFTGSTETGRKIAVSCAPFFKKVSLEMGGKNPCILLEDAPLKKVIPEVARSIFSNQGQICLCSSRILIQKSIYEEVKSKLIEEAVLWKNADPLLEETKSGALVSESHLDKVLKCVEKAKVEGGKILCGGKRAQLEGVCEKGYFFEPTLIEGLSMECETNQEEIFGPVATLIPFKNETEALALANQSQYGLSASVWSADTDRALKLAESIHSGVIWVNAWMKRDLRTPFGGMKNSGLGREGGFEVYRFFTEPKSITYERRSENYD